MEILILHVKTTLALFHVASVILVAYAITTKRVLPVNLRQILTAAVSIISAPVFLACWCSAGFEKTYEAFSALAELIREKGECNSP